MAIQLRNVMRRNVFTLPSHCSVDTATWALVRRGIGGAPVHDASGQLVGFVTLSDLDQAEARIDQGPPLVHEVMTPALYAVNEDDDLTDAVELMVHHEIRRVLVMDARGTLVGIVTAGDIQRALSNDRPRPFAADESTGTGGASAPHAHP